MIGIRAEKTGTQKGQGQAHAGSDQRFGCRRMMKYQHVPSSTWSQHRHSSSLIDRSWMMDSVTASCLSPLLHAPSLVI